jgi:ABC-type multidrug transport system fused ATPase/permease subunit
MAFFLFGAGSLVVGLVRSGLLIVGSLSASRGLHSRLLARVVRLPMSFFDSQPTGRLLNRFTKDTESVDLQVGGRG